MIPVLIILAGMVKPGYLYPCIRSSNHVPVADQRILFAQTLLMFIFYSTNRVREK